MDKYRSTSQNSRYHAVLGSLRKIKELTVKDMNPAQGIRDFTFSPARVYASCRLPESTHKLDTLKLFLKKIDLDYPRDETGDPISSTLLSGSTLNLHIEAIIKMVYDAGSTLKYEEDKKERDEIFLGAISKLNLKDRK